MKQFSIKFLATSMLTAGFFGMMGFSAAATPNKTVVGVPINTFCSTYAKDIATKPVAIGLIVKIKDNPSQKTALMRQYATFISLGKINCKDEYAPEIYGFKPTTYNPSQQQTGGSIDISKNTPIIVTKTGVYNSNEDYFTGYDTTPLKDLNSQQIDVINTRIAKAKTEYGEIVDDLINKGWLQTKDKNEMAGKITFKFSNNCSQLDGKILVRQWYNQYNQPMRAELINLFITINLCFTHSYDDNYESFLDRIIYHELGHFYQYFYDQDNDDFTDVCRSGNENICSTNDFISPYARTSPDEDYAEMFAHYVYDRKPVQGAKLLQKVDYFKIRDPKY